MLISNSIDVLDEALLYFNNKALVIKDLECLDLKNINTLYYSVNKKCITDKNYLGMSLFKMNISKYLHLADIDTIYNILSSKVNNNYIELSNKIINDVDFSLEELCSGYVPIYLYSLNDLYNVFESTIINITNDDINDFVTDLIKENINILNKLDRSTSNNLGRLIDLYISESSSDKSNYIISYIILNTKLNNSSIENFISMINNKTNLHNLFYLLNNLSLTKENESFVLKTLINNDVELEYLTINSGIMDDMSLNQSISSIRLSDYRYGNPHIYMDEKSFKLYILRILKDDEQFFVERNIYADKSVISDMKSILLHHQDVFLEDVSNIINMVDNVCTFNDYNFKDNYKIKKA